jgi:predicted nucleic acid-binding protein
MTIPHFDASVFIDANVLIRSVVPVAPLHDTAYSVIKRLNNHGYTLWISRQVIRELMVFVTRRQEALDLNPMTAKQVQNLLASFYDQFVIVSDTHAVGNQLIRLLSEVPFGGKQVHDANIVATMLVYNVPTLLTFNIVDFERFTPRIQVLHPQADLEQLNPR